MTTNDWCHLRAKMEITNASFQETAQSLLDANGIQGVTQAVLIDDHGDGHVIARNPETGHLFTPTIKVWSMRLDPAAKPNLYMTSGRFSRMVH